MTAAFTLGNLGASESRCSRIKLVGENFSLECSTGLIANITHIGVLGFQSDADQKGLCATGVTKDDTGNDCESLSEKAGLYDKIE